MKTNIRAYDFAELLAQAPDEIEILSLDCFDTLLWRDVQAPRDVFAGIDMAGGALEPRMWAEGAARRAARLRNNDTEVDFQAIYERLLPNAGQPAIDAAVAHELALEARHCFAFAPTVALMRAAKERGLQVIIVSDTYLNEDQLGTLIARAAGQDVRDLIDRIFVSSAFGVGKGNGMFKPVLKELGVRPEAILHCGDNRIADQVAPDTLGIHTAHLVQFDEESTERLRHEAVAAAMIDPTARLTAPISQTHRAEVAMRRSDAPADMLGHDVLGPLMYDFACWVKDEVAEMSDRLGKQVRPLFLMRDGHLPLESFRAAFGDDTDAAPVEISRFVSSSARLTDRESLKKFVLDAVDRASLDAVSRALMLFGHEAKKLTKLSPAAFCKAVTKPDMARKILARSAKFTDRLVAHLNRAGVHDGDAVMLVDLGYNGSVQNLVGPVLEQRMGLTVAGRYLLLREEQQSGLDKRGLLDTRHYETRALHSLCMCVAVIEQLSTVAQGSVIDYSEDGEPIRKEVDIKGGQSAIRDQVQAACIEFARNAGKQVIRGSRIDEADARRRSAAAVLSRLLFMPTASEIALLEAFDHDVNLGTTEVVRLLDPEESSAGLRRRGLSYLNETGRMFIPGELRQHGLPLNLALFTSSRFALDIRNSDFAVGGIKLPVILMGGGEDGVHLFDAHPTAEGFYRVNIPVAQTRWTPAVQLGAICEWAQVDSAQWHRMADFDRNGPASGAEAVVIADGMTDEAGGLYRCEETGFLMAPPPQGNDAVVLSVIFRPVIWRQTGIAQRQAA
ncbi:hydrolase [Stakelama marina]|uniref:Hydrolase n=1 Tax=Stakelama marina TaxID=2826939 RepID=A0A8T4IEE3_9SPHN|nr:hydrolase [Stakelama marina]MBR0553378.1 hydrolase [Stakelama marina]